MKKTEEQIRSFVEDHYYCDSCDGKRPIWEPFENYPEEWIEDQIDNDIRALTKFLED